jgi:3-hydroxyacyl-CoA dehydrogenase
MSALLSSLDDTYYIKLVEIIKNNLYITDDEVDKFLEEMLRQYLEKREVNMNDFIGIIKNALLKIRILDKLSRRDRIIVKNEKRLYDDLYNTLTHANKKDLKNAFVYSYIKSKIRNG